MVLGTQIGKKEPYGNVHWEPAVGCHRTLDNAVERGGTSTLTCCVAIIALPPLGHVFMVWGGIWLVHGVIVESFVANGTKLTSCAEC